MMLIPFLLIAVKNDKKQHDLFTITKQGAYLPVLGKSRFVLVVAGPDRDAGVVL